MTKPKQKQVFTSRRMSRIQTLQLLFESDLRDSYNQEDDNNISTEFTNLLITGIKKNIIDIDKNIKKYAPDWPINQMPIIDKNILRVAIYEIIYEDSGFVQLKTFNDKGEEVYEKTKVNPGKVFNQSPKNSTKVKIGRKINLWIVSDSINANN